MDTLFKEIYMNIRERVIDGFWQVGDRINEKELAESLHISRTPLRKALEQVYNEGLLDYTKNVGYHIRVISVEDVYEIYKIRTALEKIAFVEASKKMDVVDRIKIKELLDKSKDAVKAKNTKELIEYSNLFNEYIYKISKMPRLLSIQTNLQNYLSRFRMISFSGTEDDRSKLAAEEHEAIFEAMVKGDEEKILDIIEVHLNRSLEYILQIVLEENKKIKEKNLQ